MDALALAVKMGGRVRPPDPDPLELALKMGGKVAAPDYDALAAKFGGRDAIDYDALAAKFGGVDHFDLDAALAGRLESVLKAAPISQAQRANAWDAYSKTSDPDQLAKVLNSMNLPRELKADLWDMKSGTAPASKRPTIYEVQSPKTGRTYEIEAESMPSGAQLQALLMQMEGTSRPDAGGEPASKGFAESFVDRGIETVKGLGSLALDAGKSALTLEGQAKFLPRLAANIYRGAVESGAEAINRQTSPERKGLAAVPVVGPYVMNAISDIEEGKGAEVGGRATFDALSMLVPGTKAGRAAVGTGANVTAKGAKAVASAGKRAAVAVGPEVAAGIAGEAISGGLSGGVVGAYAARRLRPRVAAWLRSRGMTAAQAEATAAQMNPRALVNIAEKNLPPQALIPEGAIRPSAVSGSTRGGIAPAPPSARPPAPTSSGMAPSAVEVDPARLGQIQTRSAPPRPPAEVASVHEATGLPLNPDGTVTVRIGRDEINIDPGRLESKPSKSVHPSVAAWDKTSIPLTEAEKADALNRSAARWEARGNRSRTEFIRQEANKAPESIKAQLEALNKRSKLPSEAASASPAQIMAEKVKERVLSMKAQKMSKGQIRASVLEDLLRRRDGFRPVDVQKAVDLILEANP